MSLAFSQGASPQGFVNLDFERATVPPTPPGGFGGEVDPASAFPGWTVEGAQSVLYNNRTLGNTMATLIGPIFPDYEGDVPLQGSYSVWLGTFGYPGQPTPSLSQIGRVPFYARSLSFLSAGPPWNPSPVEPSFGTVTLGGVALPLVPIGGTRFAADVSAYAGQIAELRFLGNIYFDDVQFSTVSVPEPNTLSLSVCISFLWWWLKRPKHAR
jgi:hypothetical protein